MLYKIAHIIRDKFSWLWDIIEYLNSFLFYMRYGKKLKDIDFKNIPEGYEVTPINAIETKRMVEFFACQPEDAFKFFHPHGFDEKSIKKLQKNKAFLGYVLMQDQNVVGYVFLRCFFNGKCFRGKMVDFQHRGKGYGKILGSIANEIAFGIGLKMFATVSPDNIASFASTKAVNEIRIIKRMPNGDYYIEELPKKSE